jgi:dipeptidyl aminopeptidase/acylaminoacyl peptidase
MIKPYGTWGSPISAEVVARARRRLGFPRISDGCVWWQEARPTESGRTTVVMRLPHGRTKSLLPAPWDARSRVHEQGGQSYLPIPDAGGTVVFANLADQRLYRTVPGGAPSPLTPAGALRYADLALSADGADLWCVQERHAGGNIERSIVTVPLDGSGKIRERVTGADFFASPTPSPDGRRIAWIAWNHPSMPWDGTELRVAEVGDSPMAGRIVMGGPAESVLAPSWRDSQHLYVVSDRTGWWNLYLAGLDGNPPRALHPAAEEYGYPLWELGGRPYAALADGRLAVVHGERLGILDPHTGVLTDLSCGYDYFEPVVAADGYHIVALAGRYDRALAVVRIDARTAGAEPLRGEVDELPDPAYLPAPRRLELPGPVHAVLYPPAHPGTRASRNELPPYVVWVHGGPTGHDSTLFDLTKAYFTSRGIGIAAVNYRGSTGYGRAYREALRGNWGIADVADAIAVARALCERGEADGNRLAIRGASAGGWTALAAVTTGVSAHGPVFGAATSYFGIADLELLAAHTHDFESRYLDGLVGPLPASQAIYRERSPIGHIGSATCPILLLQGKDDPVVPPGQAETMARELAKHGISHACLVFDGESHGFRKAETVITALRAELAFYARHLGFTPDARSG